MMELHLSRRLLRVWQRNLLVYRKTWKIAFVPPLTEPLLYLTAFGVGMGGMVGRLAYGGTAVGYTAFIAPGMIAINIMQSAFFETTYSSFVRMYYQRTFDAMLATPLTIDEVITGEMLWGASKAVIGTVLMMAVVSLFGLLSYPDALLLLPVAFLGGLTFASAGMICTAIVPTIETFNLPIFLFITPMFLFSGTFFPVANLPGWAQLVAKALPLTHLVELCRGLALGRTVGGALAAVAYLVVWNLVAFPLALWGMRRRLIR